MPGEDPLSNFIGNLAKKIQVAKDHKHIMEAVYASASATETVEEQEDPFASFLRKIGNTVSEKLPPKEPTPSTEQVVVNQTIIQEVSPTIIQAEVNTPVEIDKPVKYLAQKIKDAIERAKFKAQHPEVLEQEEVPSTPTIPTVEEPADRQITSYINELEKIKDTGTVKQKEEANTTLKELKEYIDKTVQDYSRRILDLGGGGGSVAVQYVNGGTMNGDLNINGHILSGGRDISNYFGSGGGGGSQTLSFNESNADLSISGGNTVSLSALSGEGGGTGDSAVNALVHANSGQWDTAYSNLVSNSAAYLSGYDLSSIAAASGSWDSTYTTVKSNSASWSSVYTNVNSNSAYYALTNKNITFGYDVTIQGNLTALGTSTFQNTIFTTTSALSVVNTGPGPALYVYQQAGPYDVASFYDGDGIEVLHVGNAQGGGNPLGQVGINTSFPSAELTVNGAISSNGVITVLEGNSNQWNTAYSTVCATSAFYISNTITPAGFPGGYTFSNSDNLRTFHVDTTTAAVSVIFPSTLSNNFSVTLITLGTNMMQVSSTQTPFLCANGSRVFLPFASTLIYKYNNLLWGLGSFT